MKIILDAMGGDNAPDANIKGAIKAVNKVKAEIILVGKEEVIRSKIKEFYGKEMEEISDRLKIHNATETIEMEDQPTVAIKHKKDSSMVVGFNMLAIFLQVLVYLFLLFFLLTVLLLQVMLLNFLQI